MLASCLVWYAEAEGREKKGRIYILLYIIDEEEDEGLSLNARRLLWKIGNRAQDKCTTTATWDDRKGV